MDNDEAQNILSIAAELDDESYAVFVCVTRAIMSEFPNGEVSVESIEAGLRAVLTVTSQKVLKN